ncbi:MAG: FliG C-terminal domain-containing protein [Bacteriovorax sp.]|jgi:hypothetical protein
MKILNKYKKHFDQGFKDFVMNLDLLPSKVAKEMIANALFEDPVYLKWALENKLNFDYFLKLNKEDVLKIFHKIPNARILFLRALKNHPEENNFITANLPSMILKQYLDDREMEKITVSHQEDARTKIMQAIFDLKDSGELEPFEWKLPPVEVLSGTGHVVDKFGHYNQYYEGGVLALTGLLEKGKRSGLWKNFYPNGALHAEGNYVEGEKQEEWQIYFLNGKLKSCGHFKNDLKHGDWKEFELNNEFKIIHYVNGRSK